ncbi:hypothetical protein QCA50_017207 [Cerrena zonata]|uniref:Uncharacterized protein n=1 Tax=Cerrena zonata TaxID=2478898 RepID=A0AAW0FFJ0_9APHY
MHPQKIDQKKEYDTCELKIPSDEENEDDEDVSSAVMESGLNDDDDKTMASEDDSADDDWKLAISDLATSSWVISNFSG